MQDLVSRPRRDLTRYTGPLVKGEVEQVDDVGERAQYDTHTARDVCIGLARDP